MTCSIRDRLLDHEPLTRLDVVNLMIEFIGAILEGADRQVEKTNEARERFNFLERDFRKHQLATMESDEEGNKFRRELHQW